MFFDPAFSRDGKVSCSTCHNPEHAFSDGRKVAIGTGGQSGTRNTPSLLSLSQGSFFWDGRVTQLEKVVLQPFTNPVEMGLATNEELLRRLKASSQYRMAFRQAFPGDVDSPTLAETAQALSAFVRSTDQRTNAYDQYRAGDRQALMPDAQRGLALFTGNAGCSECHHVDQAHVTFTDDSFHSTLANPQLAAKLPDAAIKLTQTDLPIGALNAEIESDPVISELGHFVVTHDPRNIGAFRTPSLRNVAQSAPYMHDGSVATLREAVDREIYYRSLQSNRPNTLTEHDRQDLVAFLNGLTSR